jgi:hypothetical protein
MIYKISQYLNEIIRPLAQENMKPGTFEDEIDFIQQFDIYASAITTTTTTEESVLTPTTLFCTIKVLNYFTLDTHVNMIDTICNFIQEHVAANRVGKVTIATIKNLLQLSLCHTLFCYKNDLYTFTKGGPTTLPLFDTLSNIYLFVWQKKILRDIQQQKEFFGRYESILMLLNLMKWASLF